MSQTALAEATGLHKSYISKLEAGRGPRTITLYTAGALAKGLGVSPAVFLREELPSIQEARAPYTVEAPEGKSLRQILAEAAPPFVRLETVRMSLRGSVPAGSPWPAEEAGEYLDLPASYVSDIQRPYALRISGDSLADTGIHDGDIVIVDPDAPVLDGKTYVVRIGAECTAKRIYRQEDRLLLVGANGTIDIREPAQVENLGRVVLVFKAPRRV